jgi:zinc protease
MLRRVVLFGCVLAACATPPSPVVGAPWPHELSDLQPDPALHLARLPNGFRYAWQQHAQPPGRCSLRLIVHVGSADEGAGEEGMAHFVEHMAFNGTSRFPGDSVVEWFRQRGMAGGADVNAFTSPIDTSYAIDLPTNDRASLRDALDVLCDMTAHMTIEAAEVEAEKGVIDAEQRERSTPRAMAEQERHDRLLAGCRAVEHTTIGTATGRAAFTHESLRTFHSRWYRPDNMTLVLVGDVQHADVPALVAASFAALPAPSTPPPQRAARGAPTLADTRFTIVQPDRTDVEFWVFHPVRASDIETLASRQHVARLGVAAKLGWLMLSQLTAGEDAALTSIDVEPTWQNGLDGVVLGFRCAPAQAKAAVARVASAFAGTLEHGFDADLIELARSQVLREFDEAAASAAVVSAARIANGIAHELAAGMVPIAPADWVALERREWLDADAATAASALRAAWPDGDPALIAIAPAPLDFDPVAIWRAGTFARAPLLAPAVREIAWPYACPTPGPAPVSREHDASLDAEVVTFANRVRLLVKRAPDPAGEVRVALCVGGGLSSLPEDLRAAALVFEAAWRDSGLGKLSAGDLRSATFARRASVDLATARNAWVLHAVTNPDSLGFQLEWLRAQCTDPGWSQEALDRAVAALQSQWTARSQQPADAIERFLPRIAGTQWPSSRDLPSVRLMDLQRVSATGWRDAPLTLIVVGDVNVDAAVTEVARTFGTLPQRAAQLDTGHLSPQSALHEEQELQVAGASSCVAIVAPLDRADWTNDRAAMAILARQVEARLLTRIRERLGATYHAVMAPYWVPTNPPFTMLLGSLSAPSGGEQRVLSEAIDELGRVQRGDCTIEELHAASEILRNEAAQQRTSTTGWLWLLADTHGRAGDLDCLSHWAEALDAVTVADVQRVAARILRSDNLSTLVLKLNRR